MIDDEVFVKRHSLFQRCLPPGKNTVRPFGSGRSMLDQKSEEAILTVLSWDYMGAAEFERGECAKCLVYMYDNRDKLVATQHRDYFFLSLPNITKQAYELWDKVSGHDPKNAFPLRHTVFKNNVVGWFDFKNGFFVSTQQDMRDALHKLLLEMTHT
jgi:hypothetical protein